MVHVEFLEEEPRLGFGGLESCRFRSRGIDFDSEVVSHAPSSFYVPWVTYQKSGFPSFFLKDFFGFGKVFVSFG